MQSGALQRRPRCNPVLQLPDGQATRLKVRSLVGLLPLCESTVLEASDLTRFPKLAEMIAMFRQRHAELMSLEAFMNNVVHIGTRLEKERKRRWPGRLAMTVGPLLC